MARVGIPRVGVDAICEDCELLYPVKDGQPVTQAPYTCDDCGGAVEVVTEAHLS